MVEGLTVLLDSYRLGDLASIIGLAVALVGFVLTFWAAWRSRTAAEAAAEAAERARAHMLTFHSTASLASVISRLEGLKALHRNARSEAQWQDMPERYSALRAELRQIRARYPSLDPDQRVIIQRSIETLTALEEWAERAAEDGRRPADIAKMNSRLAQRSDELVDLLHGLQLQLEVGKRDD